MGYGEPKMLNSDIKKEILEKVSQALDNQADVFQGSQAFYGYTANFTIDLAMIARGETKVQAKGAATAGEPPKTEPDGKAPPPVVKNTRVLGQAGRGANKVRQSTNQE